MMPSTPASAVTQPALVAQHVEEAALLRMMRGVLVRAPHVDLQALARSDNRLAAHLDGCAVAGDAGLRLAMAALEASAGLGECFVVAVRVAELGDVGLLASLRARCAKLPEAHRAVASALGWVSASALKGVVASLLAGQDAESRALGVTACAMHRVAPGAALSRALQDGDIGLRATGWQVAAKLGALEMAEAARDALRSLGATPTPSDAASRAAAWALTLWGEGGAGLARQALIQPQEARALPPESTHRLAVLSAPLDWGRVEVRRLGAMPASDPDAQRRMVRVAAWLGDPQIVPWLIHRMADPAWGRLVGEAFSLITGADLDGLGLFQAQPEAFESGPSEAPDDELVGLDEDEGLLWPDQAKVQAWWQANAHRFLPGQRYFVGEPPSPAHCLHVLKTRGQRARIIAAEHLCLLRPGTKLFPVAAPAWRQSRWLAEEEAALASSPSP